MVNEFKNEKLQETLIVFNREKTDSAFRNLLDAFISTNFLIPAQWDKDPSRNEKGVLVFEPNTQFQLSLIQNDKEIVSFRLLKYGSIEKMGSR